MVKNKTLIIAILGIIIGYTIYNLTHSCNKSNDTVISSKKSKLSKLVKEAKEKEYRTKIVILTKKTDKLTLEINKITSNQSKLNLVSKKLQKQTINYINQQQKAKTNKDTATYFSYSDSLQQSTLEVINHYNKKDSTYNLAQLLVSQQVAYKDSMLLTMEAHLSSLKTRIDNCFLNQQVLEKQLFLSKKELKRSKAKAKLKMIGILFVTGITLKTLL